MESPGSRMSEDAAVLREAVSMNILIVDDEPSIRETCAEVARQAGMKAFAVASAEEALEVGELRGRHRVDGLDAAANQRAGPAQARARHEPDFAGNRSDPVWNDRFGGGRHALGRRGLCNQTFPYRG